ncbi:MAG TPA: hypothetical protein PLE24_04715 [Chitinispirillaceae bacterium]|jgi:hypothetical protein|nr:hypothetical protein [Chitinispirillaceae bacterium]
MKSVIISLLALIFTSSAAEFVIVSQPGKLSIFDQYEQPLSEEDKKQLLPNSPFQIINRNELMGDQITEALRFSYQGRTFFLRKGDGTSAFLQKTLTNCTVINDTVQLKSDIRMSGGTSPGGSSFPAKAGQKVIRVFRRGNDFYLLLPGQNERYGWYSGPSSVFLTSAAPQVAVKSDDLSSIEQIVKKRIDAVNDTYRSMFDFFNEVTNQQKSIPSWTVTVEKKSINCKLSGPSQVIGQLEQSTRYIVQDLEQSLLGKPFTVSYTPGKIEIGPRQE